MVLHIKLNYSIKTIHVVTCVKQSYFDIMPEINVKLIIILSHMENNHHIVLGEL